MKKFGAVFVLVTACSGDDGTKDPGGTPPVDPTETTDPTTPTNTPTDTTETTPDDTGSITTTSQPGDPLTVDVTDRVYAVDLASGNWVQPAGVGVLIASQLGDTELLVSPTAFSATEVDLLSALGAFGAQDLCVETIALPDATWTDPTFAANAPLLALNIAGFAIDVTDLALSGVFRSDGSMIGTAEFAGSIDTRTLGDAFGLPGGEGAVCDLVAVFGVACGVCGDGEVYCLDIEVTQLNAPLVSSDGLVERDLEDIENDPACN